MLCQECGKRPASLHFSKIVNGDKSEYHLCETCAREKGELIPGTSGGFSIHNLLSGLLNFETVEQGKRAASPENLRCEVCGMTYSQFSKLGRFGCSSCYKYFNDRLDPLFKRVHGNTVHTGKVPVRVGGEIRTKRQIEDLKRRLQESISQEEFEAAAQLRDQIRELERQISE
ncbi:UvrB/UvrC motif-containing protein [Paenibacillus physcomitrellae]|uniref:Protein-arginine kinase activator protein n=1 Tax=Paenibacillus physcomitrellae TaxID=1619311 RepID=A0ABQ1GVP9_9BACL|nr:UvrB/UvrC motif-containing protein [Paenibacillus physcomitrellae]GGA51338.1 protein-arginine kinase activator protein [Paenibacillus physcomitrellae]